MASGLYVGFGIFAGLLVSAAIVVALVGWVGLSIPIGLGILAVLDVAVIAAGYWTIRRAFRVRPHDGVD